MAVSAESLLPCNVSAHDLLPEGGLLTFIVPASGRSTLHRTLISLQQQENPEWRALVLLDGAHVGLEQRAYRLVGLEKARMRVCCLLKRFGSRVLTRGAEVSHGSAGLVRNVAFAHVRTPWVGFVDDDDTVGPRYVAEVAADGDTFDAIFFRMRWTPWQSELRPDCFGYQCTRRINTTMSEVLPEWNASFVEKGYCGISFAMRTKLTRPGPGNSRGLRFGNSMFEDYYMRVALYRSKLRVLQRAHVMYYKGRTSPRGTSGETLDQPDRLHDLQDRDSRSQTLIRVPARASDGRRGPAPHLRVPPASSSAAYVSAAEVHQQVHVPAYANRPWCRQVDNTQ